MNEPAVRIELLSTDERLDLLEKLWDSLSETPAAVPVTPAQQAELDRRSDALDQDAAQGHALGVPWDEVVRQLPGTAVNPPIREAIEASVAEALPVRGSSTG